MIHFPSDNHAADCCYNRPEEKWENMVLLVLNQRSGMHMGAEDTAQSQNKYLLGLQLGLVIPV